MSAGKSRGEGVPDGWQRVKLGDAGEIVSGGTPSTAKAEYWDGAIPWITPSEVTQLSSRYADGSKRCITELGLKSSGAKLLPKESLIVCTRATLGDCAINRTRMATNQGFKSVIPHESFTVEFLFYLISHSKKKLFKVASGSTFLEVSKTEFEALTFDMPPLPEQRKIAAILSTWDDGLATLAELVAAKRKQKRGLAQLLLTGERRLEGFAGEWETVRLEEAARVQMGTSPKSSAYNESGDGLPLIQGNADIQNRLACPRVFTSEITKACSSGDIILSVRAPVGSVAKTAMRACVGRGVAAIRSHTDQEFLYQYLMAKESTWGRLMQGSTFESVTSKEVRGFPVRLPPLPEQRAIAGVLSTLDAEIAALEGLRERLQEQKRGLMDELLTGRTRVRV